MRIAYLVAFNLCPAIALSVDFRGVEIGDTCRHAAQVEASSGARPQDDIESMIEYGVVAFEDTSVVGQHARYLYSCRQTPGVISRYSISIKTRSEAQAWQIYAAAKAAAVARLGAPPDDSATPDGMVRLRQLRSSGLTWDYAFANWKSVEHQSVFLFMEKPPDDEEWNIDTIVSAERGEPPDKPSEHPSGE